MKAVGWLWFLCIQMIALIAMVIGWVLLIPLSVFRLWRPRKSRIYPDRQVLVWRGGWLTWIWGNEEEGVCGPASYNLMYSEWDTYLWSAWRNSANNLRFIFAWPQGPYFEYSIKGWYFAVGFKPITGWPVLSAGISV
jgi:hypothetical protein